MNVIGQNRVYSKNIPDLIGELSSYNDVIMVGDDIYTEDKKININDIEFNLDCEYCSSYYNDCMDIVEITNRIGKCDELATSLELILPFSTARCDLRNDRLLINDPIGTNYVNFTRIVGKSVFDYEDDYLRNIDGSRIHFSGGGNLIKVGPFYREPIIYPIVKLESTYFEFYNPLEYKF